MENAPANTQVMHTFNEASPKPRLATPVVIWVIVIFLGVGTGYIGSRLFTRGGYHSSLLGSTNGSAHAGQTYGSKNIASFKDTTEGVLKSGGVEGEGQYHLVRPGGDSQNVYLTSSVVDLSQFIDHKIKVWGQTQKAQRAGWLMDVGRVEVQE